MTVREHALTPSGSELAATAVGAKQPADLFPGFKALLQPHLSVHSQYTHPLPNALAPRGATNDDAALPRQERQSYAQYLFGAAATKPEDLAAGQVQATWGSYTDSRIYVRLFSRGLMGATFYTLANRWIPKQLQGYRPDIAFDKRKPLQYLARGFDVAYGKPWKAVIKQYYQLAGKGAKEAQLIADEAVCYRPRRNFGTPEDPVYGRSMGAEIVGMTFDFAAGSTGDAWGRQIANMFDPNFPNSWEDKQDGHIHWDKFAKAVSRQGWQIFSKNQGEDWGAAFFYIPQMKLQRKMIDKLYPGFRASSDHQFNGGSWRLNPHGDIVSSYAKAGALDLQLRFTGYNWYTLMYRDLYDNIASRIRNWRDGNGLQAYSSLENYAEGPLEQTAHFFRYVIKSAIKATIYMTPAVPFFWVTRTPQTKAHGMGIILDDNTGRIDRTLKAPNFDPFAVENTRGVFDRALNPFGKACFKTAESVNKGLRAFGANEFTKMQHGNPSFMETWVNSSASYTPYMIAKAETALRWDRDKDREGLNEMDRSIYRLLDGVVRFNLGEVSGGLHDIREHIIHPLSNEEIQAKRAEQEAKLAEAARNEQETEHVPQTTVSEIREAGKNKTVASAYEERTADAGWKHRHLREEFLKDPFPSAGVTIH